MTRSIQYYTLYYKGAALETFTSFRDAVDERERLIRLWKSQFRKVEIDQFYIKSWLKR